MDEDGLRRNFTLAKIASEKSNYRIRMGAVLLQNGRCISVGCNTVKSHPKWSYEDKKTIHAEADCLRAISKYLHRITKGVMFVYREHRDGLPGMAKPCENCQRLLREYGVKTVYYSTNEFPFWDKMTL